MSLFLLWLMSYPICVWINKMMIELYARRTWPELFTTPGKERKELREMWRFSMLISLGSVLSILALAWDIGFNAPKTKP